MITNVNCAGISNVKRIIVVSSGKGGVGKSTIATQLALSLWRSNHSVGLLDIDLCGPSIPRMLGVEHKEVRKCDAGWLPVYADATNDGNSPRFAVMSIGFLLANQTDSVVWKGAKKNSMIESLMHQVHWGVLDYLVIDTPPGTSDEKITLATIIKTHHLSQFAGALLVTTPQVLNCRYEEAHCLLLQGVALSDVRKEVSFYQRINLPILGLIENMSGLCCPRCGNIDLVFSTGGGAALAAARQIPFLGSLPLLPDIAKTADTDQAFLVKSECCADLAVTELMNRVELAII